MAKLFPKDDADIQVSISTHSIIRTIALTVAAFLLLLAIQRSAHTLSLIGAAFFLSLALNAPVRWLARHLPRSKKSGDNRTLATTISVFVIVLLFIGFLSAIVPPLTKQTVSFVRGVPQLIDDTKNGEGALGEFVVSYKLQKQVNKLSEQLSGKLDDIGSSAIATVSVIGSSLVAVLTVMVLTVMMLLEGPRWRAIIEQSIPSKKYARYKVLASDMNRVVQGYVNGQVLLAAIAALLITPIFFIAGVSYPLALAVIVFICGLIPMVGHTIGAIICTAVALFTSLPAALIVLGFYIGYQQIENYAVQPRIQANSTNMSPLLVFVAVLMGANFGGLLGALVAIPVAGCLRILLLYYLESRKLLTRSEVKDIKTEGGAV